MFYFLCEFVNVFRSGYHSVVVNGDPFPRVLVEQFVVSFYEQYGFLQEVSTTHRGYGWNTINLFIPLGECLQMVSVSFLLGGVAFVVL